MVDLNTLIPPDTGFQLTNAFNINDRGEILAKAAPVGFTPNDDADLGHLALLIPCEGDHQDCDDSENVSVRGTSTDVTILRIPTIDKGSPRRVPSPSDSVAAWQAALAHRYHVPFGWGTNVELPKSGER